MKKIVVSLLALTMVFGMAFAAGGKDSGKKKTTVTFWVLNSRQGGYDPLAAEFNAANPDVEVKISYYDTDGMKDASKVAAASGTLPNMWFNWGGALGGFYADNGLTYDLSEYAKTHNWDKIFTETSLNLCRRNGELIGYPVAYTAICIYYRKDLFNKYNIAVPKTFEDFEKACATLKANGIIPISTAGKFGWHVMRLLECFVEYYAGPELHDSMNQFKSSYNNEAMVKAFEKYKEFVDKGYFPEGFLTADPNDTKMALFSGAAAMDIQGQFYDGNILQAELSPADYGVFPFPSGSNRLSSFAEMTQMNKNNTPEELEACIRFMDYCYTPENANKHAAYLKAPIPKLAAIMPPKQPNVPVIIKAANDNGTFTITDQVFPTQIADVLFNMEAAVAMGQATPKEAAKNVQDAIEKYMKGQ